ncbi:hypothetical protein OL239_19095 [Arthrobacter sp. ATA002]|uniref:hypothetical protein n=1 Tax=Arthrobacter sp. ATA002 TaxID=2991715 RepID=UPI0022A69FDF|nr:hypothetical protein [Arthrobacter sp. ATA002]WAP51802.1 hypothetical protein OL239_19095 [Arthrobacter sp. ATA002]
MRSTPARREPAPMLVVLRAGASGYLSKGGARRKSDSVTIGVIGAVIITIIRAAALA